MPWWELTLIILGSLGVGALAVMGWFFYAFIKEGGLWG